MERKVYEVDVFQFESRQVYERAKKEQSMIETIRENANMDDGKSLLKIYNKFVGDKTFSTIVGYTFLTEIRKALLDKGLVTEESLSDIPIKEISVSYRDTMPLRDRGDSKYKRKYEEEKLTNHKFKIILVALFLFLIGIVVINLKSQYSVFTYFTNYKANMEEELVNKYEKWEQELKDKEHRLNQ